MIAETTNGAGVSASYLTTALRTLLDATADKAIDDENDAVAAAAFERLTDAQAEARAALAIAEAPGGDVTHDLMNHLHGDLRDSLLAEVKRHIKWSEKDEREQRAIQLWATDTAAVLTKRARRITAAQECNHMPITIGKFTVDAEKGIVCTFGMTRTDDNLVALNDCIGEQVLLVPVDVETFMHQRSILEPDRDQPGLPLEQPAAETAPVDGDGKPVPHDPKTGEIIETPAEQPAAAVA